MDGDLLSFPSTAPVVTRVPNGRPIDLLVDKVQLSVFAMREQHLPSRLWMNLCIVFAVETHLTRELAKKDAVEILCIGAEKNGRCIQVSRTTMLVLTPVQAKSHATEA